MKEPVPTLKKFTVGDETLDLNYLLNAPYEDIREASENIPAAIGWMGYHRGVANERLIIAEQAWKAAEATAYFALKNGGFISGGFGEKVTEEGLKKALELDKGVKDACAAYATRKRHVDWISASIDALKAKLELVRSSEVTRRLEDEPVSKNRKATDND